MSTGTFGILADPYAFSASTRVSLVFPTNPCVEDASAVVVIDQPNRVRSAPVRFGRVCALG